MMLGFTNQRDPARNVSDDIKSLKFYQNTLKVELDLVKNTLTPKKLLMIDETEVKLNDLKEEFEILEGQVSRLPSEEDMNEMNNKIKKIVEIEEFQ